MFCSKCGTENPAGSFCRNCGEALPAPAPTPVQPAVEVQPAAAPKSQVIGTRTLTKNEYIKTAATPKCKRNVKISLILTLVIIASMVASYFVTVNTHIVDIPFISLAYSMADDDTAEDFDDTINEAKTELDDARDALDEQRDNFSEEELEAAETLLDSAEKCVDCFSINNIKNLVKTSEETADFLYEEHNFDLGINDDIDTIIPILNTISAILIVCIALTLFFSVLGGLVKNRLLVVLGMIGSFVYCLTFCSVVLAIIVLIAHIALIVVLSNIISEYKSNKVQPIYG